MVGVQAGVDDGDPGACAGVAGGPGVGSAEHAGGGRLEGLGSFSGGHGLILLLDDHIRNTHHGGDLIDAAVGNVGGDDVGSQGHVPDHIQLLALQGPLLDGGGQLGLLIPQGLAVCLGGSVGSDALGGELLQGGLVLQDDGYTDSVCLSVFLPLIGMLHRLELQPDVCVNAFELFDGELMAGLAAHQVRKAPGMSHGAHAEHHAQHEHHRQYSDHRVSLFHFRSSSSDHFICSANTPVHSTKTPLIIRNSMKLVNDMSKIWYMCHGNDVFMIPIFQIIPKNRLPPDGSSRVCILFMPAPEKPQAFSCVCRSGGPCPLPAPSAGSARCRSDPGCR